MKKLSFVLVAVLSIAAFGCKKKGGGDCASAVHHSMDLSKADMQKMGTDDKMMQKMVDVGIQHCKDDKWSADAIKCMNDAQTMNDSQACYTKLSAEQQSKMNKAAMELMAPPADMGSATPTEAGSAAPAAGSDSGSAAAGSAAPAGSAAAGSGSAG
jgi:hypothetical protein